MGSVWTLQINPASSFSNLPRLGNWTFMNHINLSLCPLALNFLTDWEYGSHRNAPLRSTTAGSVISWQPQSVHSENHHHICVKSTLSMIATPGQSLSIAKELRKCTHIRPGTPLMSSFGLRAGLSNGFQSFITTSLQSALSYQIFLPPPFLQVLDGGLMTFTAFSSSLPIFRHRHFPNKPTAMSHSILESASWRAWTNIKDKKRRR